MSEKSDDQINIEPRRRKVVQTRNDADKLVSAMESIKNNGTCQGIAKIQNDTVKQMGLRNKKR